MHVFRKIYKVACSRAVVQIYNSSHYSYCLTQGLKHAARWLHLARGGVLCGPWCFLGISK